MNATFVLDRSNSANFSFPFSLLSVVFPPSPSHHPKPFSPESPVWAQAALRQGAPSRSRSVGLLCPAPLPLSSPPPPPLLFSLPLRWVQTIHKTRREIVQKPPSTNPFSWSLFHRDGRLGKMASANVIRFSIRSLLSFHEEVCDVRVAARCSPLASNTRSLSGSP